MAISQRVRAGSGLDRRASKARNRRRRNRAAGVARDSAVSVAPSSDTALLQSGFEEGLNGWSTAGVGEAMPTVVSSPVQTGSHAAKFTLTGSENRSELIFGGNGTASSTGTKDFTEGSEYWYGFAFYIQQMVYGHPGAHNIFMQFKSEGEGSPNFGLMLWNYEGDHGEYKADPKGIWSTGEAMGSGNRFLAPAPEQQWNDIAIHFRASSTGTGFYEVFLNGKLIDSRNNVSMIVPGRGYGYIKNGIYRNGEQIPGTSELLLDSAKLGTSQASVQPG